MAQAGYLHSHPEILGKKGLAEWDRTTKGKKLPKKIKSYEHGGEVTETGPALLHKGEAVIPKMETSNAGGSLRELMAEKLGSGQAKKKKAKLHMAIHKLDDNKFMVEHSYRGGSEPTPESTQHAPANLKELHAHLDEHYGGDEDAAPDQAPSAENA